MLLNLTIGDVARRSYHLDVPRLAGSEIEKGAGRLHRLNSNMDNATSTTNICDEEASTRRRTSPGSKFVALVSRNRRHLALALAAILVVAVAAASVLVTVQNTRDKLDHRQVCNTSACWRISQRLRRSMNESVDPCEDFYEFACQRWDADQGGPIWQSTADTIKREFGASRDNLLQGRYAEPNKAESYLINFVEHCQNDKPRSTSEGMDPVLVELKSMGGYPLFEPEWTWGTYCWMQAEARLAHMGYNQALLQARFDVDPKRHGRRIIVLGLQPLMFTRAVLDKEDTVTGIRTFLRNVALSYRKLHNGTKEYANEQQDVESQITEMFNFSRALLEDLENETTASQKPQRMTVEELSRKIPEIKWLKYLRKLTSPALQEAGLPEFNDTDSVMVLNLEALRALAKFLGNCRQNTHHVRAMANYIGYKFLINSVFFSPQPEIRETYYNYTMQQGVQFNRTAKCRELVETLRLVSYHHYFRTNQHKFDQQRALAVHMLDEVKVQFNKILKAAAWIDSSTRTLLIRKLANVHALVGYTEWLLNATNIYNFYQMDKAPKTNGPFLERLVYHRVQKYNQQVKELFLDRNPEIWQDINAETVNAAYHIRDVNVKVYAGMLLEPFSYLDVPIYVNYGTVGFVAGHEIIHAFDDRGITIDEFGVDFEKDQWSNATRQEFNRRMQSLIDFYAKTFQVNGSHTRNENLADTSAARFSFKSYRHEQGPTKARVLPGFEKYTNDQLYFLSFASIWCNNNKYDPNSIYSNNHARVNGPLMNLDEFAETFQCSRGSKMNPTQKAPVWNI
ncbi:neprilysin-1-like isoform X1 [Rhipicephalus microplus]|uniref:neprilysin-1-like isoform X1 n=2 Tax=Rhipicephalus microplus TaxID=6941 RepID=UPI003F6AAFD8